MLAPKFETHASLDLAILIIAIHSALYIFRPPSRPGKGGLYSYRHIVYATWLILPAVLASLAFLNKQNAFVAVGTVCYLPVRPFWYRLALAWVPRYLIFFIICAIYAAIYIYVSIKFKGFNNVVVRDVDNDSTSNNVTTEDGFSRSDSVMLGPVRWDAQTAIPLGGGNQSIGSSSSATAKASDNSRRGSLNPTPEGKPDWENCGFLTTALASPPITIADQGNPFDSLHANGTVTPKQQAEAPQPDNADAEDFAPDATVSRPPLHTRDTLVSTGTGSRTFAQRITDATTPSSRPRPRRELSSVQKTRLAIRRQLRFLFIYPMVYILLWIIPFCSHALGYNDYLAAHPPFWLYLLASMILALQGAVNALVFSWRERPWDRVHASSESHPFSRPSLSHGPRSKVRNHANREVNLEDGLPEREKVDRRETFGGATIRGDGNSGRNLSGERKMSMSMPAVKHWFDRHNSTATYDSRA